jgi:hypothetical protein
LDDLRLFRLLREPTLDAGAIVPLLRELAELRVAERVPFFGLLERALTDGDAELRRAAARALGGANGVLAFRRLVTALADEASAVRAAAVEALRASSDGQPARWAHVVFHSREDVRRAGLEGDAPLHTGHLTLAAIADPACSQVVLARVRRGELVAAASNIPLVLDLHTAGHLGRADARALLRDLSWPEAADVLKAAPRRSLAEEATLLAGATPADDLRGHDALDELLDLVVQTPEDDDAGARRAQSDLNQLGAVLPGWPDDLVRRVVTALLVLLHARGGLPDGALRLLAIFHPWSLGFRWIPREQRARSALALYNAPSPRMLDDADVRALLEADVARRPSDGLDLAVVGAVLHLVHRHPYARVVEWFGAALVCRSFMEDVHGSVPFLSLEDDSEHGKAYLIELLASEAGMPEVRLLALTVLATPWEGAEKLVEPLAAGARSVRLLVELLRLLAAPDRALTPKKQSVLAALLGARILPDCVGDFLAAWLALDAPAEVGLGLAVLGVVGTALDADDLAAVVEQLDRDLVRKLVAVLPFCTGFPHGKELRLAHSLASDADPAVRAWARERLPVAARATLAPAPPASSDGIALDVAAARAITSATTADLEAALAPCLKAPVRGLTAALAARGPATAPSIAACVALLGAHDPRAEVDAEFARFGSADPTWLERFDAAVLRAWDRERRLPLLGHAWLHRWEAHAFAFADALVAEGVVPVLRSAATLHVPTLRAQIWDALASVAGMWRWRNRAALDAIATAAFGDALADALPTEAGEAAARTLVTLHRAGGFGELLEGLRARVLESLPDLSSETRRVLAAWVDSRGLAPRPAPRAPSATLEETRWEVRTLSNLDLLATLCCSESPRLAEDAALRLMELGDAGLERLAAVLVAGPPALAVVVETIGLWPEAPSLHVLRARADELDGDTEVTFRIALALAGRGERAFLARAVAATRAPSPVWFVRRDWDALLARGVGMRDLALSLADSPHPHAYTRAVEHLVLAGGRPASASAEPGAWMAFEAETTTALRAFLDGGTERLVGLRRRAARWLLQRGDTHGFPLILEERADRTGKHLGAKLPAGLDPALVEGAVRAVLLGGVRACDERLALELAAETEGASRQEALHAILTEATSDAVRSTAASRIDPSPRKGSKLHAVAETFAWGVRMGRELTGRVFKVQMIGGAALGYTRLSESRIHVTALPILRRDPRGREIVEGLILHELGHHVHHRGVVADETWKASEKEGIFGLLNLVADEHLERNLRAVSPEHGDRLKLLDAWAFQHAAREVPVATLVDALGARSSAVLTGVQLDVARDPKCVAIESGAVLGEMERGGLAFARFMRALRMGLGNRHADPKVEAGLALFKDGFRRKTMPELLSIARALRGIFGWETRLVGSFGPHEGTPDGVADGIIHGDGITGEEVDAEVERILDPGSRVEGEGSGKPGRPWINVNPNERFDPITSVVGVPHDPVAHALYAKAVLRDALRMRRYLESLGLSYHPQRMRLSGRRFDRTRASALVVRGDPRVLIARELRVHTDLFIGVLVDCSGSMQAKGNIERAKHFAVLLAEAGRGLPSVDVRVFGFTDAVIYDAGDAKRCGAHALVAAGGNNDAAALWHAAGVARASRRRAKLLVMVSDGLPTECSVAALRAVVTRASGKLGICCAQVAVAKLAEECFPHHVLLEGDDTGAAVRRFGGVVARLVRRAMRV